MAEQPNSKTVQVVEEIEGEHIETNDYFFDKLGNAIPIMSDGSIFDVQNPPAKPLTVSERLGLIFAAHSYGFCVAKTKEVVASAKEIKEKGSGASVQELSIVDVPIGRVTLLALSSDSSKLAAVVGRDIHCFSVNSLLQKDKKPFFSCSVESDYVKDLLWTKDVEASLVVLTGDRKLLTGAPQKSLENIMNEVDAVGTSFDRNFVAVARKSTLSIYSSKFSEILHISLPLNTWMGYKTSCAIKVDSIRWIRSDSIMVGCLQLTEDGEENYYVQVIKSKENTIIDGSLMLAAVNFSDLFLGIVDDIVPFGCGPHLFMEYLENCELAFVANRKNTDEHIMLFTWSKGDDQVSVVHIERDKLIPRVEYQESGDENLVLGLCIDKTSVYDNVNVDLGDQEQKELPSHCLLICLTLEGKLIMFNVASIAGSQMPTMPSSGLSSDAQHVPVVETSNIKAASLASEGTEKSTITSASHASNADKVNFGFDEISASEGLNSTGEKKYDNSILNSNENLRKESAIGNVEEKPLADVSTHKTGQLGYSSKGTLSQFSLKDSHVESLSSAAGDGGVNEIPRTGHDQSLVKNFPNFGNSIAEKTGTVSWSTPSLFWSSSSGATSGASVGKSPLVSQSATQSTLYGSVLTSTDNSSNTRSVIGNLSSLPSETFSSSTGKAANNFQKSLFSCGFTDKPLGTSTSKVQSRESVSLLSPIGNTGYTNKGSSIKSVPSGQQNSEQDKQYCNVQSMANELDKLLESIGGFTYACTTAHRVSLETLEDGMKSLSERCRVWKSLTEERVTEVQLLLDKTVQVLAREKHMEGIVSQTNDEQYWDLWSRQKLSSELDLKRRNVFSRSQDLINQLIELEKHFNAIELNLFGESGSVDTISRALQFRSTSSRHIQSLQTVHSATISQLAAAQHLSELLSRQMAALNVKSPPAKRESLKKQLFESIGITDPIDNIGSSSTRKMVAPSSNKNLLVSSTTARKESQRKLTSSVGSHEPESARRRRDSLDRSWANFEAPRTTVKRMLVENKGHNVTSPFSSRDNEFASPFKREDSIASRPKFLTMQDSNGVEDTSSKLNSETVASSMFKWAGTVSETSKAEAQGRPRLQALRGNNFSAIQNKPTASSPLSSSFSASLVNQNVKDNDSQSGPQTGHIIDKSKPAFIEDLKPFERPPMQEKSNMQPQLLSPAVKGGDIPVYNREDAPFAATASGRSPLMGSANGFQFSPASGASPVGASSTSAFMVPASNTLGSITSTGDGSIGSAKLVKDDSNQVIQRPSSASSISSSVTLAGSKEEMQSTGSFIRSARESLLSGLKPSTEVGAETRLASTPQPSQKTEPSTGAGLKFGFSTSSTPASEVSKQDASRSPLDVGRTGTNLVSTPQPSQKTESSPGSALKFGFSTSSTLASEVSKQEVSENPLDLTRTAANLVSTPQPSQITEPSPSSGLKFGFSTSSIPASEVSKQEASGNPLDVSKTATLVSDRTQSTQSEKTSGECKTPSLSDSGLVTGGKDVADAPVSHEEDMEEEAPETNETETLSLGSLGGFGIGSSPSGTASRSNPFGAPITSTPVSLSVPSGELFRPASFSFQSLQPSQQSQPPNIGATNAFGSGSFLQQPPSGSGFGQPGQIGSGQAALGSVLGSFGQSRQIGVGLPSGGFGGAQSAGGFPNASPGGGFAGASPTGGFASIRATGGGFSAAATGGGFAAAATGGGGFAAAATGGGFGAATAGGGFGAAATGGSAFRAFSNQGTGGFGGFGTGAGSGGNKPASDLFTQMRR